METKGRRSLRAAPTEALAGPAKSIEAPPPLTGASEAEPPKPAETLVELGKSTETAVNLVVAAATTAAPPSIAPIQTAPTSANPGGAGHSEGDTAAALVQSQAALARGLEALSAEMAGLALSGMNELARTATRLLSVKTLSDAIEVNTGFTCTSFDALVSGSAKLSELGVKLAAETSQPLLSQLGRDWSRVARLGG